MGSLGWKSRVTLTPGRFEEGQTAGQTAIKEQRKKPICRQASLEFGFYSLLDEHLCFVIWLTAVPVLGHLVIWDKEQIQEFPLTLNLLFFPEHSLHSLICLGFIV